MYWFVKTNSELKYKFLRTNQITILTMRIIFHNVERWYGNFNIVYDLVHDSSVFDLHFREKLL